MIMVCCLLMFILVARTRIKFPIIFKFQFLKNILKFKIYTTNCPISSNSSLNKFINQNSVITTPKKFPLINSI